MYGIFAHIYHQYKPNVGKYSIHGAAYGLNKHSPIPPIHSPGESSSPLATLAELHRGAARSKLPGPGFIDVKFPVSPVGGVPSGFHDHIAGMTSPFLIGNTSTQSRSIFQPAILDYRSVNRTKFSWRKFPLTSRAFFGKLHLRSRNTISGRQKLPCLFLISRRSGSRFQRQMVNRQLLLVPNTFTTSE